MFSEQCVIKQGKATTFSDKNGLSFPTRSKKRVNFSFKTRRCIPKFVNNAAAVRAKL